MSDPFDPRNSGPGASPRGPNPFAAHPSDDANPFAPASHPANPFAPASHPANPFASTPTGPSDFGTVIATPGRPRSKKFVATSLLIAVVLTLVLAGLGAWAIFDHRNSRMQTPVTSSAPSPAAPVSSPVDVIAGLLKTVPVVAELPNPPGYDRSCSPGSGCVFGPAWTDTEHTGCDTRNRVLAQQLEQVVFKPGTRNCKVLSGLLHDPYTGDELQFGPGQSADIQIDHVYALGRAWDAGAANWPLDRRVEFANDTGNLLAVSGKQNGSKSDSGPDTWMPPNVAFDCDYATIYLKIAAKYSLMITHDDEVAATRACAA